VPDVLLRSTSSEQTIVRPTPQPPNGARCGRTWQPARPGRRSTHVRLGVGFVAIRKEAGLFPGEKLARRTPADYRGRASLLRLQRRAVLKGDRILLVDDWIETGVQALTTKELILEAGADFVGATVVVDETSAGVRAELAHFSSLVPRELLDAGPR
jgi:hypothetical protein